MYPLQKRNSGFSLIELAVILTIVGLALGAILEVHRLYMAARAYNITSSNRNDVTSALAHHLFTYGYLPCPAAPGIPPTTVGAGEAVSYPDGAGSHTCATLVTVTHNYKTVDLAPGFWQDTTATSITYGLRMTKGFRQSTYGWNQSGGNPTIMDPVLIGSVPYVDLHLTISQTLDGWNNRLLYAVSYFDTQSTIVNSASDYPADALGSINVLSLGAGNITNSIYAKTSGLGFDSNGTCPSPGGQSNTNTHSCWATSPGTYMFVVLSHGQNGNGAWTYSGSQPFACDTVAIDTPAVPSPTSKGRDNENCNGDATFLLSGEDPSGVDGLFSLTPGPKYYDDVAMSADLTFDVDKWEHPNGSPDMYNKLGGFVGINNSLPVNTLDVGGNIKIDQSLQTTFLCDGNGKNCLPQMLLGGPTEQDTTDQGHQLYRNTCPGGLVTGFANGEATCLTAVNTTNLVSGSCASGQYLQGFDASGHVVCVVP